MILLEKIIKKKGAGISLSILLFGLDHHSSFLVQALFQSKIKAKQFEVCVIMLQL